MDDDIRQLFDRYAASVNSALRGDEDTRAAATMYADAFVASSPEGLATGQNDDALRAMLAQGYDHFRRTGTQRMQVASLTTTPLGDGHAVAHVGWRADYAKDGATVPVEFTVHYFVRQQEDGPKVFGWVSGDEQALLREHGLSAG